ncbi:interleukin-1 alpha [Rhynchocyon petersi]
MCSLSIFKDGSNAHVHVLPQANVAIEVLPSDQRESTKRITFLSSYFDSENEDYISNNKDFSPNQKPFYNTSYGSLHDVSMGKVVSQNNTSETSNTATFTCKGYLSVVTGKRKIPKKRRLSLNQPITDEDREAVVKSQEEEIKPRSAFYTFPSNMKYTYTRILRSQCILNDILTQSLVKDSTGPYLRAAALQNLDDAVRFDISGYIPISNFESIPVTLRISKSRLFLSAENKDEPILLKEMPTTPKVITDETNLLFLWEHYGNSDYFRSLAYPDLFIATKEEDRVHLAKGEPSTIDFRIWES